MAISRDLRTASVRRRGTSIALLLWALLAPMSVPGLTGQEPSAEGMEVGVLPAINFDADEGFGYGLLAEIYDHGNGTQPPYLWTVQPTFFRTVEGRQDIALFLDAPHVLEGGWRLTVFLGLQRQVATPYYGVGNVSTYDPQRSDGEGPDPYYYRFGRNRRSATVTLRRRLGETPVSGLLGMGIVRTTLAPLAKGVGTTLLAQESGVTETTEWGNYVRGGLIWDSRDRENGTRRGTWTEILVQRVSRRFGADRDFTRWTFTDRRYFPLTDHIVFAHRYLLQGIRGTAPVHELNRVQGSFRQQEGLGGSGTVRGLLKNRFAGRGMLVWNAELRWRALEFGLGGRRFHTVFSAFVDQGRVWTDAVLFDELLSDLHRTFGGGVRLGMGESFVAGVDIGRSAEAGLPMYVGLGYVF